MVWRFWLWAMLHNGIILLIVCWIKSSSSHFVPLPSVISLWPSPNIMVPESSETKNLDGTASRPVRRAFCSPEGQFSFVRYSLIPSDKSKNETTDGCTPNFCYVHFEFTYFTPFSHVTSRHVCWHLRRQEKLSAQLSRKSSGGAFDPARSFPDC